MIRRLFGRKKSRPEPLPELPPGDGDFRLPFQTDLHSHLIPGIDDGVPDMERALHLLRGLEALGYRRLITTPHVMADAYRNSSARILAGWEALCEAAEREGVGLEIAVAAEYYLDEELQRRLEAGDILTIGEHWLLFETSYYNEPLSLEDRIYEISARGYRPMMAHPERYRYVRDYEAFYGRLREMGVALQVNINSLGGYYGRDARAKALWLAERGWIDFLGSDIHAWKQVEFLERSIASGVLEPLILKNAVGNDNL